LSWVDGHPAKPDGLPEAATPWVAGSEATASRELSWGDGRPA